MLTFFLLDDFVQVDVVTHPELELIERIGIRHRHLQFPRGSPTRPFLVGLVVLIAPIHGLKTDELRLNCLARDAGSV